MKFTKLELIACVIAFSSCGAIDNSIDQKASNITGWNYNDENSTGFELKNKIEGDNPVGMVAIQGGSFSIGERGEFITAPRNNTRRNITVNSFYMDRYEVSNINWREYVNWLDLVFGNTAPSLVTNATPDVTVWRNELAYNEPYLQNYYEHPAFNFYPVVGITWEQAMDFCTWRTDRVNELLLIQAGVIEAPDFKSVANMSFDEVRNTFVFNTQKYLLDNSYNPTEGNKPKTDIQGNTVKADQTDGILKSDFRLPTEAEWEFAAYAPIAHENGLSMEGKLYPWLGNQPRNLSKEDLGKMQANFVRGRGDMMGLSGALNDGAVFTAPVNAYAPNDFGLYNIVGNVNEWVLDVYSATSFQDVEEYNSFRGNVYTSPKTNGTDSIGNNTYEIDSLGRVVMESKEEDDVRLYNDGDNYTTLDTDFTLFADSIMKEQRKKVDPTDILAPKIAENTRVYKGGSWKDRIYWLNPSTRRYMEQNKATNTVGFRCAMSMLGDSDASIVK